MASLDDVRRLALALPEVEERLSHGSPAWFVGRGGMFVWDRPLRGSDLDHLGDVARLQVVQRRGNNDNGVRCAHRGLGIQQRSAGFCQRGIVILMRFVLI